MALPNLHAPDDEWAEERVKRMMEPEKPIDLPTPGAKIAAQEAAEQSDTASPEPTEVPIESNDPTSDDGIDEIIDAPAKPTQTTEDEPTPAEKDAATNDTDSVKTDKDPEEAATEAAVKDIVRNEGDDALAEQDAAAESIVMKPKLWERLVEDIHDWWDNPRERYITLGALAALLVVIFSFPSTRAFAMNLVGFRGEAQLRVIDGSTSLPLKNATVELAGKTATTDQNGSVDIKSVKLGGQTLSVNKSAFASSSEKVEIAHGKQVLPPVSLKAVGTQYGFTITDFVSGKPVTNVEVSSGTATAEADKSGKALLTVKPDGSNLTVQVSGKGYRTEKLSVKAGVATTAVSLVPAGKDVFISKQSGKYDLYSSDLDGKNKKVILAATGNETSNLMLLTSPDNTETALVSTRDSQHDSGGFLLSTLTVINIDTGASTTLEHAEEIRIVGWAGTKLVYEQVVAGASAANPNRTRLSSYDYDSNKRVQLTAANDFTEYGLIGNAVYYGTSFTDPSAAPTLSKINADGTGKQTILSQQVWTIIRTSYDTLYIQTPGGWLTYSLGASGTKPSAQPPSYVSYSFVDNTSADHALWIDSRDGKNMLLNRDITSGKDDTVTTAAGITTPVTWISPTVVVYRASTPTETADYVASTQGGQPHKVTDVTATVTIP